jgi:hypothetical protein
MTCQKFSGETEVKQEGGIMKNKMISQKCKKQSKQERGFTKNEMPSLLLNEKICFIKLPPNTLQNF